MSRETEIKITIPYWVLLVLCGGLLVNSVTSMMLYTQRYQNDREFVAKVKEIRDENARYRAQLDPK